MGQSVNFTATVTGGTAPITYTWSFGDGSATGTGNPISHIFPLTVTAKSYTVTLTASNACSAPSILHLITVRSYNIYLPIMLKN